MPKRVPEPHELENTKACSKCKLVKLLADFPADSRDENGLICLWAAQCYACKAEYHRAQRESGRPRIRGKTLDPDDVRLPVEPFRKWLETQIERDADGFKNYSDGLTRLAEAAGVNDDTLGSVMRRRRNTVMLSMVDACMVARGCHIREVYPEWYETGKAA